MSLREHDPRLLPYRKIRQKTSRGEQERQQDFIADGKTTVLRLLQSGLTFYSVLCQKKHVHQYGDLFEAKGLRADQVLVAEKKELESIVGYTVHQGFMAHVERPALCHPQDLAAPVIVLNQVRDAENVGAIVRTALAFGVTNLLFDEGSASPYIRRAVRVSMGHVYKMQVAQTWGLPGELAEYRLRGITVLGSSAQERTSIPQFHVSQCRFVHPYALVLGNEGSGMADEVLEQCHAQVRIPMKNEVDSLNIAGALAALLMKASLV